MVAMVSVSPLRHVKGNHLFYHSRQPRLRLELSHWLRAVEYLRCYPRVLNVGYLSSNILYLQHSKYQIQKKEVRQPLSHPCFHVVQRGLSQNYKRGLMSWNKNMCRQCLDFYRQRSFEWTSLLLDVVLNRGG